jgi:hypothetical protein
VGGFFGLSSVFRFGPPTIWADFPQFGREITDFPQFGRWLLDLMELCFNYEMKRVLVFILLTLEVGRWLRPANFYLRTRLESNRVAIKKVLQRVSKRIENRWGLTQLYNRLEF